MPTGPADLAGGDVVDGGARGAPGRGRARRPSRRASGRRSSARRGPSGCGPSSPCRPRARARATSAATAASTSASSRSPAARQLEGQRRVDDVAAGQAEVQVAALGPDRLGDLADEGDDVVVGRLLDLGDPRRRRCGPGPRSRARASAGTRPRRTCARATASSTRSIRLEAGLLGPDGAHLGQRVARDHAAPLRPAGRPGPGGGAMSWRSWAPSKRRASGRPLLGCRPAAAAEVGAPADHGQDARRHS